MDHRLFKIKTIEKAMNKLLLHEVNIIQTDEPRLLLEYLRSKELHD